MSTFRDPVGPQPKSVYWRRRLVVGLGLLAIIIIIALIVWPRADATPDETADGSESETSESALADETEAPPADAATVPCDPAGIQLEAITDAESYAAGVTPMMSLRITNIGAAACSYNVGTSQQVFQITSGDEVYWTSTDCQQEASDQVIDIQPGTPLNTEPIPWNRTRSSPDTCDQTDKPQVPAGGASYKLGVTVGAVTSPTLRQFLLY
jgi:hypothetical protein